MSLEKEFVKKKLRKMRSRLPGMDVSQIEKELYPLGDDDMKPRVVKKKEDEDD